MHHVVRLNSLCISFYGWNKIDLFMDAWKEAGFTVVGHLVFRKPYASKVRFLSYKHESAYLLAKGRPALPAKPVPDVLDFPYSGNRFHPTQKPVQPLKTLINAFTKAGDVVLDPFCGSGSTLVARGICPISAASSAGRRNTCVQSTCRSLETQGLSRTLIQALRDLVELRLRDGG
jgi:site-specific DNA-methyltransferase (adenine-specific)